VQAAANTSSGFRTEFTRLPADVAGPRGTFSSDAKHLLYVGTAAFAGRDVKSQLPELLPCLKKLYPHGAEVSGSGFDDGKPTWSNPSLHAP